MASGKNVVQQAIQEQYNAAEKMRLKANYPVDPRNLAEVLGIMNPVRGVNQLHYPNENLSLTNVPKLPPQLLKAVLKFLTDSDRYQVLLP
jgi:hypothetical protein